MKPIETLSIAEKRLLANKAYEKAMTTAEFKAARKELKLTQEQLAYQTGLSIRMIRYYEGGQDIPHRTKIIMVLLLRDAGL